MQVLVLDDSEMMRTVLVKHLLAVGVLKKDIQEAHNGAEALRKIKSQPFDLLLLDIVMDGINGIDVLKEAKNSQPQAKVIMCSTFGEKETVKELIAIGISDFILKPFSEGKIKEILLNHLSQLN